MSLPEWVLQASALLAAAVLLGVLARRVRLQLTVVLAAVGFLAGWLGEPLGVENPLRGEPASSAAHPGQRSRQQDGAILD